MVMDFIKEFNKTFKVPTGKCPIEDNRDMHKDFNIIKEEFVELNEEIDKIFLGAGRVDNVAKEAADLVYTLYQFADKYGLDLDNAVSLVHNSNMSKLDENGEPIFNEDGKVLKGPNYTKPCKYELLKCWDTIKDEIGE